MNSKFTFMFVMSLILGSALIVYLNSETSTTTTTSTSTTTTVPTTTTTTTVSNVDISGDDESVQILSLIHI